MSATIETAVDLGLGEPQTHRGITIVPLLATAEPRRAYVTLDEAAPLGFRVDEVDAHGSVPELLVRNPLDVDVLLYDGEEVVGAKQNRVLEASILVAAGASHPIPVACVEAGRWHDSGRDFAPADRVSHPESRRRKAVELERAPLMEGVAQHTVWAEIDERLAHTGALSATSAIADVHDVERPRIDAIAEAFPLVDGQCGAILAVGGELCLDAVSRPDAWARLWPKIRRGYLLDGLGHLDDEPTAGAAIVRFAESVEATPRSTRPSPGLGDDIRLHGADVAGSGLVLDGETIQLSAYTRRGAEGTRIARPSRRR